MARDESLSPSLRELASTLSGAYSSPISSHIVTPSMELRASFVGNSMFEGHNYRAFLEGVLAAESSQEE